MSKKINMPCFRIASVCVEETDDYAKVTIGKVVLKPSKLVVDA